MNLELQDIVQVTAYLSQKPPQVREHFIAEHYRDNLEFAKELRLLLAEDSLPLHTNQIIADKYQLIKKLGRGGFATVWLARHLQTDGLRAIKFFHTMAPAFLDEARNQEDISEYIVKTFDVGILDGYPCIVMEACASYDRSGRLQPGRSLHDLKPTGRLAIELVRQAALGAHHGHQNQKIHNDIKPSNIIATADGQRAKLADYGLVSQNALYRDDTDALHREPETRPAGLRGTPAHMAPELLREGKPGDVQSDVYSLASTLYTLLEGSPPHIDDRMTLLDILALKGRPLPAITFSSTPRRLRPVLRKTLSEKPQRRSKSAEAFALSLQKFLESKPQGEEGWGARALLWIRRHPVLASNVLNVLLVVTSLAVIAGVWIAHSKFKQASEQRIAQLQYKGGQIEQSISQSQWENRKAFNKNEATLQEMYSGITRNLDNTEQRTQEGISAAHRNARQVAQRQRITDRQIEAVEGKADENATGLNVVQQQARVVEQSLGANEERDKASDEQFNQQLATVNTRLSQCLDKEQVAQIVTEALQVSETKFAEQISEQDTEIRTLRAQVNARRQYEPTPEPSEPDRPKATAETAISDQPASDEEPSAMQPASPVAEREADPAQSE